jgi:hypothetical protein
MQKRRAETAKQQARPNAEPEANFAAVVLKGLKPLQYPKICPKKRDSNIPQRQMPLHPSLPAHLQHVTNHFSFTKKSVIYRAKNHTPPRS